MIDEYKKYKMVETICKQCGEHIIHQANFIEHRCECGNWIPIIAFDVVNKTKEEMKTRTEKRRDELDKIYGTERGNRCLESDYEECFWDGYDKGYVAGYAAAFTETYIRGL